MSTTVGELFALARALKGWSVRDIEKRHGISKTFISRLERNIGDPSFDGVIRLAHVLGIPIPILIETALKQPRQPCEAPDES